MSKSIKKKKPVKTKKKNKQKPKRKKTSKKYIFYKGLNGQEKSWYLYVMKNKQ